jgi:hypothetical protein
MIDSLNLKVSCIIGQENLHHLKSVENRNTNGSVYNTYFYRKDDDKRQPLLKYTVESCNLTITIPSVSRFTMGTSLIMMKDSDVRLFFDAIWDYVFEAFQTKSIPAPTQWKISEMDIYYDFHVGQAVSSYIDALSYIQIPKYKRIVYANQTVSWQSKTKEIKFYDKLAQCIDAGYHEEIPLAEGVLRFEVGMKSSELLKDPNIRSNVLGKVFKSSTISYLLKKYLSIIGIHQLTICNEDRAYQLLSSFYKENEALKYLGFMRANTLGIPLYLSRQTISKYKHDIERIGISTVLTTQVLPLLKIEFLLCNNPITWNSRFTENWVVLYSRVVEQMQDRVIELCGDSEWSIKSNNKLNCIVTQELMAGAKYGLTKCDAHTSILLSSSLPA